MSNRGSRTESTKRIGRVSGVLIILFLGLTFSRAAMADRDCVIGPDWRDIGSGIYVQQSKLYCTERDIPESEKIKQVRELLALCRGMGGNQNSCNESLRHYANADMQTVLNIMGVTEAPAKKPEAKTATEKVDANPNELIRTPGLLTNVH